MKTFRHCLSLTLLLLLLAGCSLVPRTQTFTPTLEILFPTQPLPTSTVSALPTEPVPTPLPTPAPTATDVTFIPFDATVMFDSYILRSGPGRLFSRVDMYLSHTVVTAIGRVAGRDWVLVQTADNQSGWMNRAGLESIGSFDTLPLLQLPNTVVLKGHVWNPDKSPAGYIGVSIQPAGNSNPDLMEHVMTAVDGSWYAYLPAGSKGQWLVGPDSYGCPPTVPTGQCSLPGTFPEPQTVTLPDASDVFLEFNILP